MDKIRDMDEDLLNQNDKLLVRTLIFDESELSKFGNTDILNDCNWTRTHNHLVHKRTLNHLAKLAK